MKLTWKCCQLAVLAVVLMAVSGCSGINASRGVSPATFLLPGIMGSAPTAQDPAKNLASAPVPVQSMEQAH